MTHLVELPAWRVLRDHHSQIASLHLRDLFAAEPDRGARLAAEAAGLYVDYSKHRITAETLRLLFELARERELERWRDRMFAGEAINVSEGRSARHVALRSATPPQEVGAALARMRASAAPTSCGGVAERSATCRDRKSTRLNSSHLGISY